MASAWEFPPYTKTIHRSVYPAIDPTNPANSAAGKVVLVTGGGAGLGKYIAEAYNKAGAKAIAILGRREKVLHEAKTELETTGAAKILTITADVLDEAGLKTAFASVAEDVGPVDVVVANAGYLATPEPAASSDTADWWKTYGTSMQCCRLINVHTYQRTLNRGQHQGRLPHLPRLAAA